MVSVIDSHFHVWRKADQPWLNGPMVPRIFGPYEPIRRDYPIEEYLDDRDGLDVVKGVYVQTNWAKADFEKEVAWLSDTAEETGWPHAIVGYADMTVDDVRPQLDRLKKYPLLRGVRMQLHWHEVPEYRFAPGPDQVLDATVRKNIARLRDYGLSFDLQLSRRRCVTAPNWWRKIRRRISFSPIAACWWTTRRRRLRPGRRVCRILPSCPTSTPSSPASAPSGIGTIRR